VQLWDRKAKRDDDLSDSEEEEGGEGGLRFEKDRSIKTSSKKPSGEVSMDISKAPSPTAGSTGAEGAVSVLEGAGVGLSLDVPGASQVGGNGEATAPSVGGGVETVNADIGTMDGSSGMGLELGGATDGDMVAIVSERDVDMVG